MWKESTIENRGQFSLGSVKPEKKAKIKRDILFLNSAGAKSGKKMNASSKKKHNKKAHSHKHTSEKK